MGENVAIVGQGEIYRRFQWEKLKMGDQLGNWRMVLILTLK